MSRTAQPVSVPLSAPPTGADSTRHLPAPAARVSARHASSSHRPRASSLRLRLVSRTWARTVDPPAVAALLLDLDQRRRRAQIAARHALETPSRVFSPPRASSLKPPVHTAPGRQRS